MIIKELVINNFMPYKGLHKITFPQHETQNVMLVYGDNMRGKTSFLNSIRWGFYGVALGRHLRVIPRIRIINIEAASEDDWEVSIMLRFINDGKEYELRRSIDKKEHVSRPRSDADFVETIGLMVDGEVVPGNEVVPQINQVIPEEISRFFLFDGELLQEYENLLIEKSDQGEKIKEHIEQALGVPALTQGRDELAVLLKDARSIQSRDAKKDKEAKSYAEQQRQLEIKLDALEKDKLQLVEQRNDAQSELDEIEDTLANTEAVQRRKGEQQELEGERKVLEKDLQELENDERGLLKTCWIDVLRDSVSPYLDELVNKRDNLQIVLKEDAVRRSDIKKLSESLVNPVCPTCFQQIPNQELEKIKTRLELLESEQEMSVVNFDDMASVNQKLDKLSKVKSSSEGERILECIRKQQKIQVELIRIDSELEAIEKEIKNYDTESIMRQRDKKMRLTVLLSRLEQDIDKIKTEIEKNNKEQDHIAKLISKSKGSHGQLSSIRVNVYQELEQTFSKGIEYLRDRLREDVEEYASRAFFELTTEKQYSGLTINKNYGLSIKDREGRVIEERSAGAEQIVALSLIDGLNRTARKAGPIVMDTPLGRLDPKHRENVLRYLPKMAQQVVLLVHEGEIDPERDINIFAERIGARYKIERVTETRSTITEGD